MKHSQNINGRVIYTITLFVLFEIIRKSFSLEIEYMFYSLFPIMIFSYYIFDIFSFNTKYRYREFLISGFLNGFIFYILMTYYKETALIFGYILYTVAQNMIKYLYHSLFTSVEKVILLTDGENPKLEEIIENNRKFCYEGSVDIGDIDKIKAMNPDEVIYPIEMASRIVNEIFSLKMSGIKVKDSMVFLQEVEGKIDVDSLSKSWVNSAKGFEVLSSGVEQRIKRFLDILMSLVILLVSLPFVIFTYFLVKLDNPKKFFSNPAFFKQ
ncbi:MAG: hypothetical protein ACRC6A_11925, partial [Fusobacteriaceae bacterium]